MSANRRPHTHRVRTDKRLQITARDLEIFSVLRAYPCLPSTFLHAFVGGKSSKRFKERLTDLYHEGYLGRPDMQWHLSKAHCRPFVHRLDRIGLQALLTAGNPGWPARTYVGEFVQRQYTHTLLTCTVLASFELAARTTNGLRFISWGEILARAPEATRIAAAPFRIPAGSGDTYVIPDALFGLEYAANGKRAYRFFALEIDRGTMPVTRSSARPSSFVKKLGAYQDLVAKSLHKSHLGVSTLFVITVTISEARVSEMRESCAAAGLRAANFLFRALTLSPFEPGLAHPESSLLQHRWSRVGLQDISIADP